MPPRNPEAPAAADALRAKLELVALRKAELAKLKASATLTTSEHAMLAEKPGLQAQAKIASGAAISSITALETLLDPEADDDAKGLACDLLEEGVCAFFPPIPSILCRTPPLLPPPEAADNYCLDRGKGGGQRGAGIGGAQLAGRADRKKAGGWPCPRLTSRV